MEPPIKPDEADCCNSCCNPCIFDVYEAQLRKYNNYINNNVTNGDCGNSSNCLSETSYTVFKLLHVTPCAKDTNFYTFEYVNDDGLSLIFKPGQHFLLRGGRSVKSFTRAFTPIPIYSTPKSFTVLIKLYEHGLMSRFIKRLQVGSETLWRGPYGNFAVDCTYRHVLFIAQGTGIAPIYAVIKEMLQNDDCDSFLKLLFCCRSCDEAALRNELYELTSYWNFCYELFVTDAVANLDVKYKEVVNTRRLVGDDLGNYLKDKRVVRVLICGSDSFTRDMLDHVLGFGVDSSHVFVF